MRRGVAQGVNTFALYDDESGEELVDAVTVQLPPLELMSNTLKAAGLAGEINIPSQGVMAAQTATISMPMIYGATTKYMELGTTKTLDLRNSMNVMNQDTHQVEQVPNRWILKGSISKADPGKVENAAPGEASIEMQVYYAKHYLDGDTILEWDVMKRIFTVNGNDMLAASRQNIT